MSTSTVNQQAVTALNSLLRGERSAVETYDQGIGKFADKPAVADRLRKLRDEHADAVRALSDHVTSFDGTPSEGSGPWGAFATAVNAAAKVIGPETVLSALKAGEEHGVNLYHAALAAGLPNECEGLIRTTLLPRCQSHLAELDGLKALIG
jgi:hypothetical protein